MLYRLNQGYPDAPIGTIVVSAQPIDEMCAWDQYHRIGDDTDDLSLALWLPKVDLGPVLLSWRGRAPQDSAEVRRIIGAEIEGDILRMGLDECDEPEACVVDETGRKYQVRVVVSFVPEGD